MKEEFTRTAKLLGENGLTKLSKSSVIVFGIGGVGGHAAEALVRSGIGRIALVDYDFVALSNINRQIIATQKTLFMKKTEAAKIRLLEINPQVEVELFEEKFDEKSNIDFSRYDYVIDAVDDINAKVLIVKKSKSAGVPIISCMSAGNKLDATGFRVSDIYSTSVCPLARIMRNKLREEGINELKTVWSAEKPIKSKTPTKGGEKNIGSVAFVVGVEGLIAAGEVIKDIALFEKEKENESET